MLEIGHVNYQNVNFFDKMYIVPTLLLRSFVMAPLVDRLGEESDFPRDHVKEPIFYEVIEHRDSIAYEGYLKNDVNRVFFNRIKEENDSETLVSKTGKQDLIGAFNENVINNRFDFLQGLMVKFLETSGLKDKLYICKGKLEHVVIDYFADIHRLKKYHHIERVGRQTIYAYLAYWIVRRQPLQVFKHCATEEGCLFANEYFATSLLGFYFSTPSDPPNSDEQDQPNDVDDNFRVISNHQIGELQKHVLYHLKYRLMDAHNLELLIASYKAGYLVN